MSISKSSGTARIRHILQAFALVWESAAGWTVVQAVTVVIQGLLPAASLYLTKAVVDSVTRFVGRSAGQRDVSELLYLVPAVIAVTVLGWLCGAASSCVAEAQSSAVSNHVQGILQDKALEVDYQCFEDPEFHNTMQMAHGGGASRPVSIVADITGIVRNGITLATVAVVLLASHAYLAPIVALAVVPGTLARILNARARHAWQLEHTRQLRYCGYLNFLLTGQQYAKETRLFQFGPAVRERWRNMSGDLRSSRLRMTRRRLAIQLAADSVSFMIAGAGIVLVFLRVRHGRIAVTMGDLAMIWRAFQRARNALGGWLGSLASLYEDALFVSHYHDFMAMPRTVCSPAAPQPIPEPMKSGIRIENVSFRYPGTDRLALDDVSFCVRPGEHVALVGENGSGKTTMAKLLCRLYDPTAGRIAIDGTDLRDFSLEELRRWMAVLFQDYARYYMTAGENIRIGRAGSCGHTAVVEAARLAGAEDVIERLPRGYDTMLGRMFEGGHELSVGQWQRVALARTLVRDAGFVILDEHTSALDPKAEHDVLKRLFDCVRGRTAIVISHRLSTVTMVDRILVMGKGAIVEEGSHEELLARAGEYSALFESQAERRQSRRT